MSILIDFASLTSLFGAGVLGIRAAQQHQFENEWACFDLLFPYDLQSNDTLALMRCLSGLIPPADKQIFGRHAFVFEVLADAHGIRHRVRLPQLHSKQILAQMQVLLPSVHITASDPAHALPFPVTAGVELGISGSLVPLRIPLAEALTSSLLASLQPIRNGEGLVLQWVISPHSPVAVPRPKRSFLPKSAPLWARAIAAPFGGKNYTTDQLINAKQKLSEPLFAAACRIGAHAVNRHSERLLIRRITAVIRSTRTAGAEFYTRAALSPITAQRIKRGYIPVLTPPCLLNASELTALIAYPYGSPMLPGLRLGASRQLPPSNAIPRSGVVIGQANFPGDDRPIAISADDLRKHLHTLGPTGAGKSTLLMNMITQDINAGRGVAVLDPKGDLINDILARIPANRVKDVVLIDPSDRKRSVGINVLHHPSGDTDVIADQVVGIFRRLFAAFWGPRTDDILRSSLLTLINKPGATLCSVPVLLQNDAYRRRMTGGIDDPVGLEPFWEWFGALGDKERLHATGPVINKLRAVLMRRSVRDIFGQETSSITMDRVLAERKILLVSLPKGQLGEDTSSLIGSIMVMLLWQAAQARSALPAAQRYPFLCYIDEFQNFVANQASSVADILAEARAFGLGLILSHQHLGQLNTEVRQAVLANTRNKIVFQTSAADAHTLAAEFAPHLTPTDLQNLNPYEAMALVSVGAKKVPPVSIRTFEAPEAVSDPKAVAQESLSSFGRDRADIEKELRRMLRNEIDDNAVGKRTL